MGVAIAYRAIQNGFEARFTTADELIGALSTAAAEGQLDEALDPYLHPHVLVIDELGYAADAANVLYRVVNDRYLKHRPMIVTTNKPLAALGQVLHDADLAEAILDWLLERGTTSCSLSAPTAPTTTTKRRPRTLKPLSSRPRPGRI